MRLAATVVAARARTGGGAVVTPPAWARDTADDTPVEA